MKFDKHVDKLLKKYPLNEDLGNIFGTLGNFVKHHVGEILAPMTDPWKKHIRKTDLSQGDGILKQVRENLIKTPNILNKKIIFTHNKKDIIIGGISYKTLMGAETISGTKSRQESTYKKSLIKEVINYIDLNKLNLISNKNFILPYIEQVLESNKQKDQEYGKEPDPLKSDMSPERILQRFEYLCKHDYFITKPSDENAKIEWLYILAKANQSFDYTGEIEGEKQKEGEQKPAGKPAGKPTPTPKPTPKPAPKTRTPAPPTRVVRSKKP
jgi:hypothetical protein